MVIDIPSWGLDVRVSSAVTKQIGVKLSGLALAATLVACAGIRIYLYHDKFIVAAESPHWDFKGALACEQVIEKGNVTAARRACDNKFRDDAEELGATTVWVNLENSANGVYTAKASAYRRILVGIWPEDVPAETRRSLCALAVHTLVVNGPKNDQPVYIGSPPDQCGDYLADALLDLSLATHRDLRLAPANDPQQADLRMVLSPGWEEPSAPLQASEILPTVKSYPCMANTKRDNGARIYFRVNGIWGVRQPQQAAFKCADGVWTMYPDTGRIGFFAN
jgi:hypothetical protein